MATIADTQTTDAEIVLSERVVTSEFRITDIHESIQNRFVRAEIEIGPFVTETRPDGSTSGTRGSSRRGVTVWENEAYDAVRDTWTNADLMARVTELIG